MQKYVIQDYKRGFEEDQVRIGIEVARNWIWPYAYDLADLMQLITHLGVREDGKLLAVCMAAPNNVRPSTAAIYYIYTPDEHSLRPMLVRVVDKCIDHAIHNVIADLVNAHRQYELVYQELGFRKVANWARCEKALT